MEPFSHMHACAAERTVRVSDDLAAPVDPPRLTPNAAASPDLS